MQTEQWSLAHLAGTGTKSFLFAAFHGPGAFLPLVGTLPSLPDFCLSFFACFDAPWASWALVMYPACPSAPASSHALLTAASSSLTDLIEVDFLFRWSVKKSSAKSLLASFSCLVPSPKKPFIPLPLAWGFLGFWKTSRQIPHLYGTSALGSFATVAITLEASGSHAPWIQLLQVSQHTISFSVGEYSRSHTLQKSPFS